MMALLLAACLTPEPQWDGDTLTLTSLWFYYGWEEPSGPEDGWNFEEVTDQLPLILEPQ